MDFKKGEILYGRKDSDAIHPILFIENHEADSAFFVGVMLTKADNEKFNANIPLEEKHIITTDEEGKEYDFQYNNTHFVNAKLLKKSKWKPFRKIGEINSEGIEYIESHINTDKAKLWEDFLKEH